MISTPTPGPSWLIDPDETGVLLSDFTPETLAKGIARLKADPALRQRLVDRGATKLAQQFSKDAILDAYIAAIAGHREQVGAP